MKSAPGSATLTGSWSMALHMPLSKKRTSDRQLAPGVLQAQPVVERHLVLARKLHHLVNFGLRHVVRENAGHADPLGVNMQHDLVRRRGIVAEELHEDVDHELLGRVVVVVQEDLI